MILFKKGFGGLMKYKVEVEIDRPVDEVVNLFDNPDNYEKWMEGLQSYEHLSGEPGQPGAKTKMKFKIGKREIEMVETIVSRNLPSEYTVNYDAKNVHNVVINRFIPVENNRTKYLTENEFQFSGYMKLFGLFMPGMFKKSSRKYLNDFKNFVERQ